MKTPTFLPAVLLSVCLSMAATADEKKPATPKDRNTEAKPAATSQIAKELATIKAAYNKAQAEAIKPVIATKDQAKREAAIGVYYQKMQQVAVPLLKKALQLIQKSIKDPAAPEGLTWIVTTSPGSKEAARAVDLLAKHYPTDDNTLQLATRFGYAPMEWTVPLMRRLLKQDLPKEKKAQLLMGLARCLHTQSSFPSMLKLVSESQLKIAEMQFGKGYFEKLKSVDSAALEKEALQVYRQVSKKYGDVKSFGGKTLADEAKSAIFEIEHLSIGKVAPDITGEDIDGVKFKLSDYRGKVVMLDFWGDW